MIRPSSVTITPKRAGIYLGRDNGMLMGGFDLTIRSDSRVV